MFPSQNACASVTYKLMLFMGIHNTLCVLVSVLKVRDNQTAVRFSINLCTSEDLLLLGLLFVDDQSNGSFLAFVVIPTMFQAEYVYFARIMHNLKLLVCKSLSVSDKSVSIQHIAVFAGHYCQA